MSVGRMKEKSEDRQQSRQWITLNHWDKNSAHYHYTNYTLYKLYTMDYFYYF